MRFLTIMTLLLLSVCNNVTASFHQSQDYFDKYSHRKKEVSPPQYIRVSPSQYENHCKHLYFARLRDSTSNTELKTNYKNQCKRFPCIESQASFLNTQHADLCEQLIRKKNLRDSSLCMFEEDYKTYLQNNYKQIFVEDLYSKLQQPQWRPEKKCQQDYRQDEDYYLRLFLSSFSSHNFNPYLWTIIFYISESPLRYKSEYDYFDSIATHNHFDNKTLNCIYGRTNQQQQLIALLNKNSKRQDYINYRRLDEKYAFLCKLMAKYACDPINEMSQIIEFPKTDVCLSTTLHLNVLSLEELRKVKIHKTTDNVIKLVKDTSHWNSYHTKFNYFLLSTQCTNTEFIEKNIWNFLLKQATTVYCDMMELEKSLSDTLLLNH